MSHGSLSLTQDRWPSLDVAAEAPQTDIRWSRAGLGGTEIARRRIRRQTLYCH